MKTFLTDIIVSNGAVVVEITLVDSYCKSAELETIEDIDSLSIVADEVLILEPIVVSERTVKFVTKAPSGTIEFIILNYHSKGKIHAKELEV